MAKFNSFNIFFLLFLYFYFTALLSFLSKLTFKRTIIYNIYEFRLVCVFGFVSKEIKHYNKHTGYTFF